ncbi:MAG: cupin domain-containing protein [Chloroflexi bacterium]|nr:cupin domain-containing protein [Chloroflexota bacterium]
MPKKTTSTPAPRTDQKNAQPSFLNGSTVNLEVNVGSRLRQLRTDHDLSLRVLAEKSGLSINTLALIENQKTSPSVSTLQQIAWALQVPITAFFETDIPKSSIAYLKANRRPHAVFEHGSLEDLGAGLTDRIIEPFLVHLEPLTNSGPNPIVHTGYEFVFCLAGRITYMIENQTYLLEQGDSLLFESHLPHRWQNVGEVAAQALLVLLPTDSRDRPTKQHFGL